MLDWTSWTGTAIAVGIALVAAIAAVLAPHTIASLLGRRATWVRDLSRRARRPWAVVVLIVALWIAASVTQPAREEWWPAVSHVLLIGTILAGAWLLGTVTSFAFEGLLTREKTTFTGADLRRRRTQILIIQRLTVVLIAVIAVGMALFSFPSLRVVGTSVLASAGIVSVIAGLAAQSIFGNLIAGIQIAFTDSIRVGDVVVINGEFGRIGELNLSYVVVYVWDERRLVIPCSYFTTNVIETWTRRSDAILGTVYLDLDWRVPMDAVRAKFDEIMDASDAWDRRSSGVVVTDSQGGFVTVRCTVSAKDSDDLWTLRCAVREQMMTWLQQEHPDALPRTRVSLES
ncbi:mechanosensitive ion channel [Microbacterium sp. Re1]|uniref:Mechanosensitive ion channel n=1 Tax=Microbacterium commune TaxID=2762219 RepID=A0ABR8W3M4_9MICO|nr:mechanosensitive ion channel domain-containing protein [Microbacterium commune]MBD8011629.1 mechanosensitive ion channel [Microbacterium commune]